jgi:hypothetical protein
MSTFSDVLLWRKNVEKCFEIGSVNKRRLLLVCTLRAQSFLLAGLGGDGNEQGSSFSTGVGS